MHPPYRIMVVEDSRTQAESLGELFRGEGWEVVCVGRAESAFDELRRTRPDLIVVDYHLPGMQGDELCRQIRMNPNTRGIPVLMLTVEGTLSAETRGLESGADDYLAKSADPDILLLRVRALLRKSRDAAAVVAGTEDLFSRARLLVIDDSPICGSPWASAPPTRATLRTRILDRVRMARFISGKCRAASADPSNTASGTMAPTRKLPSLSTRIAE